VRHERIDRSGVVMVKDPQIRRTLENAAYEMLHSELRRRWRKQEHHGGRPKSCDGFDVLGLDSVDGNM
jgi:hypothetical protein